MELDGNTVGDEAAHHSLSAEPDHAGNRNCGKEIDDRIVNRVGHDCVFVGIHVATVDFLEALVGLVLAIEKLQHDHAADVFLQIRIDAGDGGANAPVRITHFVAEELGRHYDKRQHRECNQRQLPVHAQHNSQNSQEHEQVFKNRDHAGGEHFIQCVHVGGNARDQAADRILIVESDVHALQVAEDLAAQIEHYFLSGPLHEVGLQELKHESEAEQAEINAGNLCDPVQRARAEPTPQARGRALGRRQIAVHGHFHQIRSQHVAKRFQDDRGNGNRDLPAVRTQVGEQPPHQPAVICFS